MISRTDFIKDIISFDNPTQDIPRYFNEISILYNIIGGRSDIDIFTSKERGKFGFSILVEREEEALSLRDRYNGYRYNIYGESYTLKTKLSKSDTVFITMKKEG